MRCLFTANKVGILKGVEATVVSCDTWMLNSRERRKEKMFDMKCLRRALGENGMERIMNNDNKNNDDKIIVLENMDRMDYEGSGGEVDVARGRSRPKRKWVKIVKEHDEQRDLSFQKNEGEAMDRSE